MNFTVKYRGSDGTPQTEVVSAASRADVFAQMKARGVTPTSVVEGGRAGHVSSQPNSAEGRKPSRPHPAWLKGALAGILVVILAGGAFWFLARPTDAPAEKPLPKKVEKKPAKVEPLTTHRVTNRVAKVEDRVVEPTVTPDKKVVSERELLSVHTNIDGSVTERYRTPDGKTHSVKKAPKQVFEHASDQLLAMALDGATSGGTMPPMPISPNAEKDFLASLEKPIKINDDDSEKIRELKTAVSELREEIKKRMAEGEKFADILRDHETMVNHNAKIREDVVKGLKEYLEKGDQDGARNYLKTMNEALKDYGLPEVGMPESKEARRARIREQHQLKKNEQNKE